MEQSPRHADLKVLIVEDEPLVALLLEEMLQELGFSHTNAVTTLPEAVRYVSDQELSFAILDINLHGKETYPVADILRQRSIPFAFASGAHIAIDYFNIPTLQKPFSLEDVERVVGSYFPLSRVEN
jgi:CheY-like chemotaxis protein